MRLVSGYKLKHSRRSLIQCVRSMDNGTTGRFSRSPRSISDLGHAVGCLAAELRDYCRAAFLGRQFLPVISVTDTRGRAMRIARARVPCLAFGGSSLTRPRLRRGRLIGRSAQQYGLIV